MVTGKETKEGDIRLVGGNYLWQGRVEIYISGDWGTIFSDYNTYWFSTDEARVVCRQLGYNTYRKLHSVCIDIIAINIVFSQLCIHV